MKRIIIQIEDYELKDFTNHKDEMKDYALLVLLISRKILNSQFLSVCDIAELETPFLMLDIDRNSRAYIFISYNKYISISYPLNVKIDDSIVHLFSTEKNVELTNQVISECIGIINLLKRHGNFLDVWMNDDGSNTQASLDVLELLLHTEPSYLRYDYDPTASKGRELLHPAHHLDINMSRKGKYKLGIYRHLSYNDFIDIINEKSDCSFISKYRPDSFRKRKNNKFKLHK